MTALSAQGLSQRCRANASNRAGVLPGSILSHAEHCRSTKGAVNLSRILRRGCYVEVKPFLRAFELLLVVVAFYGLWCVPTALVPGSGRLAAIRGIPQGNLTSWIIRFTGTSGPYSSRDLCLKQRFDDLPVVEPSRKCPVFPADLETVP